MEKEEFLSSFWGIFLFIFLLNRKALDFYFVLLFFGTSNPYPLLSAASVKMLNPHGRQIHFMGL